MRVSESGLSEHLGRLHTHLDGATLTATLKLMISEGRAEKQRGLIAMARLEQRDSTCQMDTLRELENKDTALPWAIQINRRIIHRKEARLATAS